MGVYGIPDERSRPEIGACFPIYHSMPLPREDPPPEPICPAG